MFGIMFIKSQVSLNRFRMLQLFNDVNNQMEHPLNNLLVLQALFSYDASVFALRRNRLVSLSWMSASGATWNQMEKYPVLRYTKSVDGNGRGSRMLMTLPEFYALYQAGETLVEQIMDCPKPAQKMTLFSWQLSQELLDNNSVSVDHWYWSSQAGKCLRQLTLVDTKFKQEIWVFQEYFLKAVPQLEQVTLRNCWVMPQLLQTIYEEHRQWKEHREMRWNRGERFIMYDPELRYFLHYNGGFQNKRLQYLDVTLKVECQDQLLPPPITIWGPLLSKLPNLKQLRIGCYELTETPALELKEPNTENFQRYKSCFYLLEDLNAPPPCHRGYFWELFWEHELASVHWILEVLDLLDFSSKAQNFGVMSTCQIAASLENDGSAVIFMFRKLRSLSFDLGLDPDFAQRDIKTLMSWICQSLVKLCLYRAPFHTKSLDLWVSWAVEELHLWGNVASSFDFLRHASSSFRRSNLQWLAWTTSCFEDKFYGKRIHHLLKEKKACSLLEIDLVKETNWEAIQSIPGFEGFTHLTRLEMDFGPLSLQSWSQLGSVMPNLILLKGVIPNEKHLAEIVNLWPNLETMEIAHRSRVSAQGLVVHLPRLENLKKFNWRKCACTLKFFQMEGSAHFLLEIEKKLRTDLPQGVVLELPWNASDNIENVSSSVCIQAEFEHALLTGDSTRFFQAIAGM